MIKMVLSTICESKILEKAIPPQRHCTTRLYFRYAEFKLSYRLSSVGPFAIRSASGTVACPHRYHDACGPFDNANAPTIRRY